MADIAKIVLPSGDQYNIKDDTARTGLDGKVSKSGDTMTGDLTLPNMTATGAVKVGNSVTLSYNSTTQALDFIFD